MKCDKCNSPAVIHQRYSGMHLCKGHFKDDVERKIKSVIRRHRMIEKNDTIAVALSGGKDSIVTLHILDSLFGRRPDIQLTAIIVDEGIKGYRAKTIETAKEVCKAIGMPLTIVSFAEKYGATLDEMMGQGTGPMPCSLCGVFRRILLNKTAKALGATKVATGHNLDDEAQAVLLNLLRGDVDRLARLVPARVQPGLIPRIKPLRNVPEKEVGLYALLDELPINFDECPYAGRSMREEIREMLNDFEVKHPGTKYALMRSFEKMSEMLGREWVQADLLQCGICGEPTTNNTCQACKLLEMLELQRSYNSHSIHL